MPTAIAAPSIAARAFDLPKPAATVPEASSFSSSLHEARQKLPAKLADRQEKKADDAEPIEPARKPEPTDRAADDRADVEPEATDEVAAPEEAEAKPEQHDDANDPTALAQQMAALAAMQAQPTDAAQQPAADAEQAAATDATTTIIAAAAAATAALPDDATIGTELAGQATPTDPNAAKPATTAAKPGDAKLDKLTAELTPTDGTEIADAVAATAANAGDAGAETQGDADADALPLPDVDAVAKPAADDTKGKSFDELFAKLMPDDLMKPQTESKPAAPKVEAAPLRPEQQFARDNVDRVVGSVQSQVNASGNGSMRVRLDPPELGALDVAVKMLDGKMTASFTTSNDQATQLLSHSLNNLKTSLENAGIAVDRIEVRQAAPSSNASNTRDDGQQQSDRGFSSQQQQQGEQQRKQMVDRLWRKYAYGTDEVDLVA
jgi:flagellar hook-length control protein FliK